MAAPTRAFGYVKILIDEMWSSAIAIQLRARGHDVVAASEREDLRAKSDAIVFKAAQSEGRAIVTDNAVDFRPLATAAIHHGQFHQGLILTSNRRFPRRDSRTTGRLVVALEALIRADPSLQNFEHWLE